MNAINAARLRREAWRDGIAALLIYFTLSLLFFGRSLIHGLSSFYIGNGPDPTQSIWFLEWWAHALSAHHNPLVTHLVWAPGGFNLAWTTNIPLAGCLMLPFTKWLGPVASYNLLCLLCPAIVGWAAFALCRHITGQFVPALFGGFIFGFSPYMACKLLGTVDLALVVIPPLAAYLAVRALEGTIPRRAFAILLSFALAAQLLLFLEVFATMTLSAAIAITLALLVVDSDQRERVRALIPTIVTSYLVALLATSPYLYYLFAFGFPQGAIWPIKYGSIDLLNFAIPVPTNALGTLGAMRAVTHSFRSGIYDTEGYLGLTLVVAIAMGWRRWREPVVRLLIIFAGVIGILAMGPRMQIAGHLIVPLPWMIAASLPLLDKVIAARLTVYMFLALAVLCAMWLGTGPSGERRHINVIRGIAAALVAASLLPNLSSSFWATRLNTPAFFSTKLYRKHLKRGETVVILPYGMEGDGMLWQALSGMYFKMAGGYLGFAPPIPDEYARWPIVHALYSVTPIPDAGDQFKTFLRSHGVGAVIFANQGDHAIRVSHQGAPGIWLRSSISARDRRVWNALLGALGVAPRNIGGLTLYDLPSAVRARWPDDDPVNLQRRLAAIQFPTLLGAAHRYVASNRKLAALTPLAAQQAGLLPSDWVGGPLVRSAQKPGIMLNGLLLGPWGNGNVAVGVEGSYPAVEPLIEKYSAEASAVYFPFPQRFSSPPREPADSKPALMMMVFSRSGLARAAAKAATDDRMARQAAR